MVQLLGARRVYFRSPLTESLTMDVLHGLKMHLKVGVLQRLMQLETMSLEEEILVIALTIALANRLP